MKRITKKIFIVLVAVAFVATGCKKESEYKTVTLGAKIAANNSKVYINDVTPIWQTGDQVRVNGTDEIHTITVSQISGNTAKLENVPQSDGGYYAIYPAEYATAFSAGQFTVTLPAFQEYTEVDGHQVVKAPMGAKTDGGSLTFHNLCSLLKVTVTASEAMTLNQIQVTATSTNLSGSTHITLGGTDSDKLSAPGTGSKKVTLVFPNGLPMTAGQTKTFYIYVPEFSSQNVTVEIFRHDNNNWKSYKKSITGASASANRINTLTCNTTTPSTIGALPGDFSVSADKKVRFSQGNLQYDTTTSQFSFMDYQWRTVETNGQVGTNYADQDIVSLFGWGAWCVGKNPRNTSTTNNDYQWGNNGEPIGGYYTLSQAEWVWLLGPRNDPQPGTNCRTSSTVNGTANARYAKANLFGTNGLIIFPDSYDHPAGVTTPTGINTNNTSWEAATRFTAPEWAKMEAAGCVFLPAAGVRGVNTASTVSNVGTIGYYWSSSDNSNSNAVCIFFSTAGVNPNNGNNNRRRGYSVRQVQDY